MKISLDSRKPEAEWASFNETCGSGDGVTTEFETPFPAKVARSLHVMREYSVLAADAVYRVLDPDGKLVRDDPDGYRLDAADPEKPIKITFQRAPRAGQPVGVSALGRIPPNGGVAFKILPLTDNVAKSLDAKYPPEFRKRERQNVSLQPVQDWYREVFMQLVVDYAGFVDDAGQPHPAADDRVKKAIVTELGAVVLGSFVYDRARALQQERISGLAAELRD